MLQPASTGAAKPGVRSKKEEEFDTSPLLVANKLKHQRIIDEQKLKVCLYISIIVTLTITISIQLFCF